MKLFILALFAVFTASASANLVYQSPYTPMADYSFKSAGGNSGDYLIDDVYVRGIGGNEIDGNERLTVKFDAAVTIQNLQLGLLFAGDTAILKAGRDTYRLEAYGFNQAHYYRNGVLIAELLEDESTWVEGENFYGMWTLHDPFGSASVTKFTLSAEDGGFGLMSFNTDEQTPEPKVAACGALSVPEASATIGLMAFGLIGLGAIARKRA